MPRLRVDAILFDLDGTLVDESRSYFEAVRLTAAYLLGQAVTAEEVEEVKRVPGFNNDWDASWAVVGRHLHGHILPPSDVDRASFAYRRLCNVFQTYYLGDRTWSEISKEEAPFSWAEPLILRETLLVKLGSLVRLSAFKLGIATSRPRAEALLALRQHALDRFFPEELVVAREDARLEKPHPAPLRELVQRMGCRHPVYVGDTINDAMAAARAGMPFVYVASGRVNDPDLARQARYHLVGADELVDLCALAEGDETEALQEAKE